MNIPHHLYIDFKPNFDSVDGIKIGNVLMRLGTLKKLMSFVIQRKNTKRERYLNYS